LPGRHFANRPLLDRASGTRSEGSPATGFCCTGGSIIRVTAAVVAVAVGNPMRL
jgi:hypothetical protein